MPISEVCDVCGQKIYGRSHIRKIEGATLKVCSNCAKFGTRIKGPSKKPVGYRSEKKVDRNYQEHKNYQEMELVEDFNIIIRHEREKKGWTQDELGQKINVRGSIIRKIENGREPTDIVRKKLEKLFNINLMTVSESEGGLRFKKVSKSKDITFGDIVHLKKKKPIDD